jgi:hypothetical protein
MNGDFVSRALRGYVRDAAAAFRQTPIEVALGIVTAVVSSILMRHSRCHCCWG